MSDSADQQHPPPPTPAAAAGAAPEAAAAAGSSSSSQHTDAEMAPPAPSSSAAPPSLPPLAPLAAVSVSTATAASSSSTAASPSSSSMGVQQLQQPSPSPSGGKYEQAKELRQLRDKVEGQGSNKAWSDQADLLRNSDATLAKYAHLLEEFMINLNPAHSTAAIVYALRAMYETAAGKKQEAVMIKVCDIVRNYVESRALVREQVLLVIDVYASLFRKITQLFIQKGEEVNGIPFLAAGIDLLVETGDQTVTSLHGCYFTLCLRVHAVHPGLSYLYPHIKGILQEGNPALAAGTTMADSRALLTYLYYGGLLAAAARDWKRSTALLKAACYVPGYAVSEIQIEALKKLHIISFIAYGKLTLPQRSSNLVKAWKSSGALYSGLAAELEGVAASEWDDENGARHWREHRQLSTADLAGRAGTVAKVIQAHKKAIEKDQNIDLMTLLMHECKLRAVLRVAEIFSVASVARVTELAKLEGEAETAQMLRALASSGRLVVTEDGGGYVRLELPAQPQTMESINEKQMRLVAITEDVKRLDLQAQKTPWYIQRTSKVGGNTNDDEGLSMCNAPEPWPSVPGAVPS